MSRLFLTATVAMVAIVVLMIGCSDDDCATCPADQYVRVNGYITLTSTQLRLSGNIEGVDGSMPEVDSVTVNGSPATLGRGFSVQDSYWSLSYIEEPTEVQGGDTMVVIVYTPRGNGTCRVVVLHFDDDASVIISPSPEYPLDTVDVNTEVEVIWGSAPRADWYAWEVWTYHDEDYYTVLQMIDYDYTHDTSLVIAAEDNAYAGQLWVDIMAVTGPYPVDEGGNFVGNGAVDGAIHAYCWSGLTIIVERVTTSTAESLPSVSIEDRRQKVIDRMLGTSK